METRGPGPARRHAARAPRSDLQGAPSRATLWLGVFMAVVAALAVLGLVAFWPRGEAPDLGARPGAFVDATIVSAQDDDCPGVGSDAQLPCRIYEARLSSGPDDGETIEFQVLPTESEVPLLDDGHKVVLLDIADTRTPQYRYSFVDFQRATPLLWLLAGFVIVVVAYGRFQGLRALAGLAISLLVLVTFVVPALLRDSPAVPVALVGTVVVGFVAIYLAHGVNLSSTIALAGTLVSLAATAVLALVVARATELSGLASEQAQTLRFTAEALDLRGLLIAGIVVGALGVLDDVTVTQVSTVAALRRANPALGARALYTEATRVGRDHVASTVNTLVLAYAGASLPLLLFFEQGGFPAGRILSSEIVSVEIVRMLVGSIGLVLSVPVTTRLAAVILTHTDRVPDDDGHGHHHHHEPLVPEPVPAEHNWRDFAPPPADPRRQEPWF